VILPSANQFVSAENLLSVSRTSSRPKTLVLPESLRPEAYLPPSLQHRQDDARYFIHLILSKLAVGDVDSNGWVLLCGEYLKRVMCCHDYAAVIRSLINAGVVRRQAYRNGVRCFGYKLHESFLYDRHTRVAVKDARLIRALERGREEHRQQQDARRRPVHDHLETLQYSLKIDWEYAQAILKTLPDINRFDSQGILVRDLHERRFRFSIGNYGRVSNSITNLSRHLRSALRHRGQELRQVDIKNAQPALLGQEVHRREQEHIAPGQQGTGRQHNQPKEQSNYDSQNSGSSALFPAKQSIKLDVPRYIELAQQGKLYEFLQTQLPHMNRERIKRRFLSDVLAKRQTASGHEYPSEVEDCFKRAFPTVYSHIRDINDHGRQHANLIRILQRAESDLVIGQVSELLRVDHPRTFFITLHDAIYTTDSNLTLIEDSFQAVFDQNGYSMSLKVG